MRLLFKLGIASLFFIFSVSAFGQVTMLKDEINHSFDSYSKIRIFFTPPYNGENVQFIPHFCFDFRNNNKSASVSLGTTRAEAISRITELEQACATRNKFIYKDAIKESSSFYPLEGGLYKIARTDGAGFKTVSFDPACFSKAISYLRSIEF